jgi:hypothetical protein
MKFPLFFFVFEKHYIALFAAIIFILEDKANMEKAEDGDC